MLAALILLPAIGGLTAFFLPSAAPRRALLGVVALAHAGLTAAAWIDRPSPALGDWLTLDAPGLLFLSITSVLFLAAAAYALGYLRQEPSKAVPDLEEGLLFRNAPEAVFIGCLLLFLSSMTLVTVSHHLGLLWIAIEATTLASAPLIYYHRHHRSLEATWKYLLICSVGIALALLGNFFIAVAATGGGSRSTPMLLRTLLQQATHLQTPWLKAAFILILVGYGTKMGLAPLHTWLPDAHSESPSVISALLSGALLNCAFLGILRVYGICAAAGLGAFAQGLLVVFGMLSVGIAAVFVLGQTDYKRLLAYSSVEHMGILVLGIGLGGAGSFGALLHALNHSLTKAMLFLVAGHILGMYQTKSIAHVRGLLRAAPVWGLLWLAGFLAITGTPPFGLFMSKFSILKAAFDQSRFLVGGASLFLLAIIFIGMATAFLGMAQGEPSPSLTPRQRGHWLLLVPAAGLGVMTLVLGVYIPDALNRLLHEAARALGGS
jgi:hydrogenase-4 component F